MTGLVVVTSRSFSRGSLDVEGRLTRAGLTVVRADSGHAVSALEPSLRDAHAWIAGTAPVTEELLALAPKLRVVARYGVGVDAVDIAAAHARGVVVTNTPGANADSVADLALALLLASLRNIGAGDRAVRRGDWSTIRGREIALLNVGVLGFGSIGRRFAARVRALGAHVVAFDPFLGADAIVDVERVRDAGELAACDAVSLHAPGGDALVGAEFLARANGIVIVNTARADLVDEQAIADGIRARRVAGYAADTMSTESDPTRPSPLFAADIADRVLLTPHIGAQTVQAIDRMGRGAVDNVLAVLAGRTPPDLVTGY